MHVEEAILISAYGNISEHLTPQQKRQFYHPQCTYFFLIPCKLLNTIFQSIKISLDLFQAHA